MHYKLRNIKRKLDSIFDFRQIRKNEKQNFNSIFYSNEKLEKLGFAFCQHGFSISAKTKGGTVDAFMLQLYYYVFIICALSIMLLRS